MYYKDLPDYFSALMHVCTFEFEKDDIKSVFSLYFYTSTKT